ncbi:nucleotide exchange factor GrpE [Selenomonas sp. TAMA-11512]|uniref:nucleotide exchange factor GrpE n=1 Tax=Selenomonas sp. TAMA-11512 TaxID=3095337 RepID=UPI00309164B2|nr:nucleotide exchange factor GrpE [Selenomonas sp. TAMA-11512]
MPAFMKDELKKKDEETLERMQREIDEARDTGEIEDTTADAPAAEEGGEQAASADAEKIAALEASLKEKEDRVLRLQADFDNFRRRTRQEKEELSDLITQNILTGLLPLLDNFERALVAEATDAEILRTGVDMIYKQLVETLEKDGLAVIQTEGQMFDPNFHQAVMRVEDPEKEDGSIESELQKGYTVKGKVVRPSMVQVVGN